METLANNLSSHTRKAKLNGREYLVAPMVMINPGVLNGSQGPLYYPFDEIQKTAGAWNHMPVVVNHPTNNGKPISARSPEVLERYGIGFVFNTTTEDGKLKAEAWIDLDKAALVDNRIVDSLLSGNKIELSTGLFTDNEPADEGATYNGKNYQYTARNYRPDHLAILPDQIGACSVTDGCGVLVNCECEDKTNCTCDEAPSRAIEEPVLANEKENNSMAKQELIAELVANCSCWEAKDVETLNALDEGKLSQLVDAAKASKEAEEVLANSTQSFEQDGISFVFNSEAKKWDVTVPEPSPTVNEEAKPQTEAEWLEAAPEGIRRAVQNAIAIEDRERASIIQELTANLEGEEADKAAAYLKTKDTPELENIRLISNQKKPAERTVQQDGSLRSYFGQTGAPAPSQGSLVDNSDEDDLLEVPTMNYAELAKS